MIESKPKVKPILNPIDKLFEISGWILLPLIWIFTIYFYIKLPQIIPTHFNFQGVADKFGSKSGLLGIASIMSILFLGLSFLNKFPHLFNYAKSITNENALRKYTSATRLVRYIKNFILLIFSLIIIEIVLNSYHKYFLPDWIILSFLFFFLIIPVLYLLFKSLNKD